MIPCVTSEACEARMRPATRSRVLISLSGTNGQHGGCFWRFTVSVRIIWITAFGSLSSSAPSCERGEAVRAQVAATAWGW